ncbi:hypothetical protein HPP92_022876 [Vanilla planifolia]|uniref:Protein LURP-one-related 5 n=1 Tax=Vanilla planifolia TaxID=51239 RepID=A0A835PVJ4_VANPL|nr:hypothetical protein HPP92_022876 [Vanilla planifolia]
MEAAEGGEAKAVVGEQYCLNKQRNLTVRKTSLFFPGDGFAAYDQHTGELVFRVETYGRGSILTDEVVLMDPAGASILTLRRKWPSLHNRWEGFLGERVDGKKPLFSVHRSSIFGGGRADVSVEVQGPGGERSAAPVAEYRVEGSFAARSCRILYERDEGEEEVVAEIKRKVDPSAHVVLSKDVFCLCLSPGMDAAFAMGIVLVLDRISGDDDTVGAVDSAVVAAAEVVEGYEIGMEGSCHRS